MLEDALVRINVPFCDKLISISGICVQDRLMNTAANLRSGTQTADASQSPAKYAVQQSVSSRVDRDDIGLAMSANSV